MNGLVAKSQNRWPSVNFDFGSINDLLAAFFPAGFLLQNFYVASKILENI